MSKHKYLTIGEVSKITEVHIKSLRYYDRIGVLKPAYIDSNTGYRYYTYSQLSIIEAIRICIELDIPLKEFSEYCKDDGQRIHYAKLLEHGKELAEKKIHTIREGLKFINDLQQEIKRNEIDSYMKQPIFRDITKKRYFVEPFDHKLNDEEFHTTIGNLYLRAAENGFKPGYEFGFLYIYRKDIVERYQFVDILSAGKRKAPDIKTFPAGRYLVKQVLESKIETAPEEFPEPFAKDYDKIVMETELFTGDYNILKPSYELRCSMPV